MISIDQKGNWSSTIKFLKNIKEHNIFKNLDEYGKKGVAALSDASPVFTGRLASSWDYEIERNNGSVVLRWINTDIEGGANVALLVQYGHGTRRGTYVEGIDFINPAIQPVFDEIAENVWKEVMGNERNRRANS